MRADSWIILWLNAGILASASLLQAQTSSPLLLIPGQQYPPHAVAVPEGGSWFGVLVSDTTADLRRAHLTIKPLDACGHSASEGGQVQVAELGTAVFLVRDHLEGVTSWKAGPVTTAMKRTWLGPGQGRDVRTQVGIFRLEAIGRGTLNTGVADYELRLVDRHSARAQALVAYHPPARTLDGVALVPRVEWVGDLDRDGRPDILIDDNMGELGGHWVLYLSSSARQGELVHAVASFSGGHC